jgi:hypothetical protein
MTKNAKFAIDLEVNGRLVRVAAAPADTGDGVKVAQTITDGPHVLTTVSCTCGSGADAKTVTKECPTANARCDCSDPKNPSITCN